MAGKTDPFPASVWHSQLKSDSKKPLPLYIVFLFGATPWHFILLPQMQHIYFIVTFYYYLMLSMLT